MIQDNLSVKYLNEDEMVITGGLVQNNIPVLEENYVRKMNANNGFSEKRMFRKIASIPDVANMKAYQDGYNLDDPKDLYRFLQENPEYMTVEKILTNRDPHIIVR
jgi:hypothetical protein